MRYSRVQEHSEAWPLPDTEQRGSSKRRSLRLLGSNLPQTLAGGVTWGKLTPLCLGWLASITTTVTSQGYCNKRNYIVSDENIYKLVTIMLIRIQQNQKSLGQSKAAFTGEIPWN